MADLPRNWAILQTLQARLQEIDPANGYRTTAGDDVRLERGEEVVARPVLYLYSGSNVRPDDSRVRGEREFTLIVEAHVPTTLDSAHMAVVAITEDIEDALTDYLQQPLALPLTFEESLFLDSPAGLPVMVSQTLFTTRYRRQPVAHSPVGGRR